MKSWLLCPRNADKCAQYLDLFIHRRDDDYGKKKGARDSFIGYAPDEDEFSESELKESVYLEAICKVFNRDSANEDKYVEALYRALDRESPFDDNSYEDTLYEAFCEELLHEDSSCGVDSHKDESSTPRLTLISELLTSDLSCVNAREDVIDKINTLHSLLKFHPWPVKLSGDEQSVDLKDLILRNLFFQQFATEKAFIQIIHMLDCNSREGPVGEKSTLNVRSEKDTVLNDESIKAIVEAIEKHYVAVENNKNKTKKNSMPISSLSEEERDTCENNVTILAKCCLQYPYLHCLTPLFIFLQYKYNFNSFFKRTLYEGMKESEFRSCLKKSKTYFPTESQKDRINAENDKILMNELISATNAEGSAIQYYFDYAKDKSDKVLILQKSGTDPILSSELIARTPVPNWQRVFDLLMTRGQLKKEDELKYMNAIYLSDCRQHIEYNGLDPEICDIFHKMIKITLPRNFFTFHLNLDPTRDMGKTLTPVYKYLINGPDASKQEMLSQLLEANFFVFANVNALAFWRITRYIPSDPLYQQDPSGEQDPIFGIITQGFFNLMCEEREKIYSYLYSFNDIPFLPDKVQFGELQKICRTIYQNWNISHTDEFCQELFQQLHWIYQTSKDGRKQSPGVLINRKLIPLIKDVKLESVMSNKQITLKMRDFALDLLKEFLNTVLSNCGKKNSNIKEIFEKLLRENNPAKYYNLRILVDLCFDLMANDLQKQLWEFYYDLADKIYPMR